MLDAYPAVLVAVAMEAGVVGRGGAGVADPADRYVLGDPVRAALPRLQHRALEAVTIIEKASSTKPTTCSPCWRNAPPRLRVAC